MGERLQQAIEIYEKTPLGRSFLQILYDRITLFVVANVSGQVVEIDPEARKALNFIETGK